MKICWIAAYPIRPKQHPAPWLMMLARGIVQEGHTLTIVTPNPKATRVERIDAGYGFEVVVIPYKGGLTHLLSLFSTQVRAIADYLSGCGDHFDVIHVHGTELQLASSLARLDHCPPYIISIQGIMSLYKEELTRKYFKAGLYWTISGFYEKKEIRRARNFFCRTDWDQQFVRSLNPRAQINLCWEILRPEFFDYQHRFRGKDILFLGGDHPLKGLSHCLKVFDRLAAIHPLIRLHIVGSVKKGSLPAMRPDIVLHGTMDAEQICGLYDECFCLYHPSLIDNSPNSVCEAQVAGLPVIANRVGGVASLITHGLTGLLVEKDEVEEHVQALERLYGDVSLQQWLSANASELARKRHDRKTIVERTLHTYRKLAEPSRSNSLILI